MFDMQPARRAFSRARAKTGKRIAAHIDIIAITTKSSIKVKPDCSFTPRIFSIILLLYENQTQVHRTAVAVPQ